MDPVEANSDSFPDEYQWSTQNGHVSQLKLTGILSLMNISGVCKIIQNTNTKY